MAGWPVYGFDVGGSRHSPLTQITPDNVADLEVAWVHHNGDVLDGSKSLAPSTYQNTPIIFGRDDVPVHTIQPGYCARSRDW